MVVDHCLPCRVNVANRTADAAITDEGQYLWKLQSSNVSSAMYWAKLPVVDSAPADVGKHGRNEVMVGIVGAV